MLLWSNLLIDAPAGFYCPLTMELMNDPVIDAEGNTFEKEAILAWLERSSLSPLTRNHMLVTDLRTISDLPEKLVHSLFRTQ